MVIIHVIEIREEEENKAEEIVEEREVILFKNQATV